MEYLGVVVGERSLDGKSWIVGLGLFCVCVSTCDQVFATIIIIIIMIVVCSLHICQHFTGD